MKAFRLRALCAALILLMLSASLLSCNQTGNEIGTDESTETTTQSTPPADPPAGEITTKTVYCKVSENHDTLPVFAELSKPYADYLANMTFEGERLMTVQLCHKATEMPVALYEFAYGEGKDPVSLTVKGDESYRYTYDYHADGKLAKSTRYLADGTVAYTHTYEYNDKSLLFKDTLQKEGEQDNIYEYEYDENGNNVKILHSVGYDLYQTTEYKYVDGVINEKAVSDASGKTLFRRQYEVDEQGNIIEMQYALKALLERWVRTPEGILLDHTVWNSMGEMESGFCYSTDKNGTLTLTVMVPYYLDSIHENLGNAGDIVVPSDVLTTIYEFDQNGEIAKITLEKNGETVLFGIYEYNADGSCARSSIYWSDKKVFLKRGAYVEITHSPEYLTTNEQLTGFAVVEYDTEENLRKITKYNAESQKMTQYNELSRNESHETVIGLRREYDEKGKLTLEKQIAEDGTVTEFFGDTGWTCVTKWTEDKSEKQQSYYAPDQTLFFTAKHLYVNGGFAGFELYDGAGNQVIKCEKMALLGPDRQNGIYFERRYLIPQSDGSYTLLTCLYEKGEMTFTQTPQNQT